MISIPRGLSRAFRAAVRKCVIGRPRGPAPPVVVRSDGEQLCLAATMEGVNLRVVVPAAGTSARTIVMPMNVLDAVEGFAVEITATGLKGIARWEGRDGPKELAFDAIRKDTGLDLPPLPKGMLAMSPTLLNVLYECGLTAAHEASRYALHRIQVHGKSGTVTGTDGRHALVWSGFKFPFTEAILIPAVPMFGGKELSGVTDVRIGREGDRFFVQAGGWILALPIDRDGRFPDVANVVTHSRGASIAGIDERDAAEFIGVLRDLLERSDEPQAITVDLDSRVTVRFRESENNHVRELRLLQSTGAGPPVRAAIDSRDLVRALSLGCLTLRLVPQKPMVAEGPNRIFVAVTLDDSAVVHARDTASQISPSSVPAPSVERSMVPMKSHESHDHGPLARTEPTSSGHEWIDPLAEAESLRAALMEAATRAGRLVQCLKTFRRQRRVLESAWSSLKSIGMGPGGGT